MKRYLIILIAFCALLSKAYGQSSTVMIDNLIKYRVITANQRPLLINELKYHKGQSSNRVAILDGLENIMLRKEYHLDPHRTGVFIGYDTEHIDKKKQDSINTSLRLFLDKINKSGLLTDKVYTSTLKDIDSGRYVVKLQLLGHLTGMSSRLEQLTPEKLLPIAEALHKNGIVSDSSFLRLENDIKNGKIESSFQLNDYCRLNRTFDLRKYSDDPSVWLKQIYSDAASMLPGLNFTGFSYTAAPDTTLALPGRVRYKVSLICDGHIYKNAVVADTFKSRQGKASFKGFSVEAFYRIFNKVLADQQSPLRLHLIMFHTADADYLEHFALIALKEEQTDIFEEKPCLSYMLTSMENYDNTLTSTRIDSTIAGWRTIGLFSHLTEAEIIKAIDSAKTTDLFSIDRLLVNFPGVTCDLQPGMFDAHYSYSEILMRVAGITHNEFNPTNITEKKVNAGVKLQYLAKGKIHSYTFNTTGVWLDPKFPVFMKGLGRENDLPGDFYWIKDEEAAIYLTKEQYDYVVGHQLLNLVQ